MGVYSMVLLTMLTDVTLLKRGCTRGQIYRVVQKTDTQFYFWDNFGNSAPILTILSLLKAEIYGA